MSQLALLCIQRYS